MKLVIVVLLCALPWPGVRAQDAAGVAASIRACAAEFGVRVGVSARHLGTGESVRVDADSLFPTASVIKLPVLVSLFRQFASGRLSRLQAVALRDSEAVPGSGVLQYMHGGTALPLIDVATLMIILSDNTATNYVIDHLGADHEGRLEAVNGTMRELGLRQTKLLNKLYSWRTKKRTDDAVRFGIGVSTPNDMARLLEEIVQGRAVDRAGSDSIMAILRRQQDAGLARRFLSYRDDSTLVVGNKTGSLDKVKNDVGVVTGAHGTYVYAIFCDDSPEPGEEVDNPAALAVARISRMLYDELGKH